LDGGLSRFKTTISRYGNAKQKVSLFGVTKNKADPDLRIGNLKGQVIMVRACETNTISWPLKEDKSLFLTIGKLKRDSGKLLCPFRGVIKIQSRFKIDNSTVQSAT
jgi:hypothetical protein